MVDDIESGKVKTYPMDDVLKRMEDLVDDMEDENEPILYVGLPNRHRSLYLHHIMLWCFEPGNDLCLNH